MVLLFMIQVRAGGGSQRVIAYGGLSVKECLAFLMAFT